MNIISKTIAGAIVYLSIIATIGTWLLMSNSATDTETWLNRISAVVMGAFLVWGAWTYRDQVAQNIADVCEYLKRFPSKRWALWILVLGVLLRGVWVTVFHPVPASDGATYLKLAKQLATGQQYHMAGSLAYWPPGYPLFMTPWVWLFSESRVAWILPNILLFCVSVLGVWKLGNRYLKPGVANLAVMLIAIWPGYVALVATPEKENLLIGLMPWLIIAWLYSLRSHKSYALMGGLLLGVMDLTQPACLLLPVALFISGTLLQVRLYRVFLSTTLLLIGIAIVIVPWSLRNYQVLGVPVLVSTNGGSGLYRANNPLATGGYTSRGEVELDDLDEVSSDREGKRLAIKWIKENPSKFISLAFRKQLLFLGDDAGGIYVTLKRGLHSDPKLYAASKSFANLFWVVYWLFVLACILHQWVSGITNNVLFINVAMIVLYFFTLHSVFESNGKYHEVLWPLLPLLLLSLVQPRNKKQDESP